VISLRDTPAEGESLRWHRTGDGLAHGRLGWLRCAVLNLDSSAQAGVQRGCPLRGQGEARLEDLSERFNGFVVRR